MKTLARVQAVSRSPDHTFSKAAAPEIELLAGLGAAGDAHQGVTVKHRSRVAQDPRQPNLRQLHLLHAELLEDLRARGFRVGPGDLGENVTTQGVRLLELPRGTLLYLGDAAVVEVTGLRNPCAQIENFQPGLLAAVLGRDEQGNLIRRAGVMGVVRLGGVVRPGDPIRVELPEGPHERLERV